MSKRTGGLSDSFRQGLKDARKAHGWSQSALGVKIGLPQNHISDIERGKTVPRYDTLLDLVRILGHDLVLVPRALVPAVHAMIRDSQQRGSNGAAGQSLYAVDSDRENDDESGEPNGF